MTGTLSIRLLGGFRLVYGDVPVTALDAPRMQSLVAYLVLHRDAPQPRRQLAYLLWPDSEEAQARTNLRNLLHHLRRALPEAERYVRQEGGAVQWAPDAPCTIDVAAFERAAQAGEWEEAAALYTGDLLPDCYDDWAIHERERLQALYADVLQRLARQLEEAREYRSAIEQVRRLIRCDPLREEPYRDLMRLYALTGDRAAAVHTYHTCADTLQRELGVEPGPVTRQAYERLLSDTAHAAEPAPAKLPGILPLVGRAAEWGQLLAAWRGAVAGEPRLVLVEGEAGIGKTRLVEELVAWATRQGVHAATAGCYAAAQALAYAPVAAWLRARPLLPLEPVWLSEVARLLPELLARHPSLPPPGPLAEEWQRQRLYDALVRAILAGGQPLLLVIEDVQWCDPDSLHWLHHLLRSEPQARLLVAGTLRLGEPTPSAALASLVASLRQDGRLVQIALGPLDQAQTAALAAHAAGRDLAPGEAGQLYRDTEGNPLFVVEAVRAHALRADAPGSGPSRAAAVAPGALPPKVQAVLAARLMALSPAARELLEVAATVGREFTFDVLRRASPSSEDALVSALDELWQRRIVRERGEDGYDLSHHYLREAAYAALSTARRRLLHRRVGEAMEAAAAGQAEDLAYHFERAQAWDKAAHYHHLAGQQAQRLYANESAMEHLDRALALAERAGLPAEMRFEILATREEVSELLGDREGRARNLDAMAALAREAMGPAHLAKVCRRRARLFTDTGRYDEAEAAAQQALALAEQAGDIHGRAAALIALGTAADLRGEPSWAIHHLRAAAEIAGQVDAQDAGRRLSAAARRALASAFLALHNYDAARSEAGAALALYEEDGDRRGEVEVLNLLGVLGMERGAFADAIGHHERGLALCRAIGYRYGEGRALVNLGNIDYVRGQLGEALARYDQGAAIFHDIGYPRAETIARMNTADIRLTVFGDAEAARADITATLAYAREAGEHTSEGQSLTVLGTIARQLGDLTEARRRLQASISLLRAAGDQWLEAQALITLVHVELDAGRPQAALASLEAAEAMCRERGMGSLQGDLNTARGSVLLALERPEEALAALAGAEEQPGSGVQRTYLAPYVRYQALRALGRSEEARATLERAYRAVLDLIKSLTPEEQQRCLERQPEFRAIAEAWRASG